MKATIFFTVEAALAASALVLLAWSTRFTNEKAGTKFGLYSVGIMIVVVTALNVWLATRP